MSTQLSGKQQTILDVLRVCAAYAVMLGHSFSYYQLTIFKDQEFFPYIQNIGVIIFFLLSGFLTVYSLEHKNKENGYMFSKFLKHKFVRIMKEYLPGLGLIALIDFISIKLNGANYTYYDACTIKQFVGNLFMLQNVGPLGRVFIPFGSGRPLWTLSVEWWFYLLFGYIYLIIKNNGKITFFKAIQLGFLITMASTYLITGSGGGLGFVFLLGVFSYYCYERIEIRAARVICPMAIITYIIYGIVVKEAYTIYSFLVLWIIFCTAIKIGDNEKRGKRNLVLADVSGSTFMLYLIHYSIIDLIYCSNIAINVYLKFAAGIGVSMAISFAAYYLFKKKELLMILLRKTVRSK